MKDIKIYISAASLLLIFYLIAQYNRPKMVDWTENLRDNDKSPYGIYVLFNRLNDIFPNAQVIPFHEPLYSVINDHQIKNGTYIIICNSLNLNEYDYEKLTEFIKRGNNVFISAKKFGEQLGKNLKVEISTEERPDVGVKFISPLLDSNFLYTSEKGICNNYFSRLDTLKALIIGKNNFNHSCFIKYPMGSGTLYLNANPLMLSNYSILKTHGAAYAAASLSYLKNDKVVLWDEYYTQGRDVEQNTMRVFLTHIQLRWAFYISFFSLVIFVLYEMKRRQRIIPVIEPLQNATLDFVTVVGQVYYEQRNNINIAKKKILFFLTHLRDEYHLKTHQLDEDFAEKLTAKVGIPSSFSKELVDYINFINNKNSVTDKELIELNKLIEQFYIKSR